MLWCRVGHGTWLALAELHLWRRQVSCFFFQAEDGIRDTSVTGVQTCALPICLLDFMRLMLACSIWRAIIATTAWRRTRRSEERRVGKECRSRGAPEH